MNRRQFGRAAVATVALPFGPALVTHAARPQTLLAQVRALAIDSTLKGRVSDSLPDTEI